ncbi:IS66 family transposase [Bradyrhizobium sp. RDT10]
MQSRPSAEAVKRIDVLFAIEREINGLAPQERLRVRQERSRPLIVELEAWLREQRAKLSRSSDTTKAINYCLSRWDAFTRFLDAIGALLNRARSKNLRLPCAQHAASTIGPPWRLAS